MAEFRRRLGAQIHHKDTGNTKYREPDEGTQRAAKQVVDAALEVHRELGPGFLEPTYEDALAIEFRRRRIRYERQRALELFYKGEPVHGLQLDLLVENCLVVELKSVREIAPIHVAQTLAYLKATELELGLIINFKTYQLRAGGIRRVIRTAELP